MENVCKYFGFSSFFKDESDAFSSNEIAYSELNPHHFLIFEKENNTYNLYVAKYSSKKNIGKQIPEILELVVRQYDKSYSEHRIAIRKYFQ